MATMEAAPNTFYYGCTPTELSRLFRMPLQTVRDSIKDIPPAATRGGRQLWLVHEVAPKLIRHSESDAEEVDRILKLHHTDLPKMLSKEYWLGKTYKQKYDVAAGNLWPTEDVIKMAGDAFKTIRLSLQLMGDTVERNEALSEVQRRTIMDLVDTTLHDMREKLIHAFKNRRVPTLDEKAPSGKDDRYADL
jgi:hypothetical protein